MTLEEETEIEMREHTAREMLKQEFKKKQADLVYKLYKIENHKANELYELYKQLHGEVL